MAYDVSVKEIAPERIVSARGRYRMAQLSLVVPRELARVVTALLAQKAEPTGGAVARYHGWNDESVDVELGYPARGDFVSVEGGVAESLLPGGKVVFTTHVGAYDQIAEGYKAVMDYAEANSIGLADTMWERYVTDPSCEPDASKYVTEIYWPLA
jgi:effector-binding domain-containing protein